MGKWLAEFQENTPEMPIPSTDSTDTSHDLSVLSVPDQAVLEEKAIDPELMGALTREDRWDPELSSQGYVWCLDCKYWDSQICSHIDNPFRKQCAQAPRKCHWYEGETVSA